MITEYHTNSRPFQLSEQQFDRRAKVFRKTRHLNGMARLLNTTPQTLFVLSKARHYHTFRVPKPNGKTRLIENPNPALKKLQQRIAFYLQAVYHRERPDCAYGFIRSTTDDANDPRNIYTNALQHIESKWVLNADLKDFFHSIDYRRIRTLFRRLPFRFTCEAAGCLTGIVTYRGRLPMGAPSSPVLSNLVCLGLDRDLVDLAKKHGWIYTRYADDLTFSAGRKFSKKQILDLREVIQRHDFRVNERKWKCTKRSKGKHPEVTGLILKNKKPDVKPEFLVALRRDIDIFHYLSTAEMRRKKIISKEGMERFRRSILGQINFVGFVKGDHHKTYHRLRSRMKLSNRLKSKKRSSLVTEFSL